MVMEPQQQVPNENGTSNGPTSPNGPRKRIFANKLNTLRTYKEIPQEDLAKGDLIKKVITPRGKGAEEDGNASPLKLDFSPPGSPASSPTTVVKATPDDNSSDGSNKLDLQKVSAMRKNNFGGEKRNVSWNDKTTVNYIPSTKYLEQLEAENAKLKARADTIYKELGVLVQERDGIEKERDQLLLEKKQLEETIKQNNHAQDMILEKTSHTLVQYEIQIEHLQQVVATLQSQATQPQQEVMKAQTKLQSQAPLTGNYENQQLKDEITQLKQKLENARTLLNQMSEEKAAAAPLSQDSLQKELETARQQRDKLAAANQMLQNSLKDRGVEFANFKNTLPSQDKKLFYTQVGLWFAVIFLLSYILLNGGFTLPEELRYT